MDNPPGHFKMSTQMIKLKSSDGEILQVEVKVAQLSLHLKEMLDDLGVDENEVISIPQNAPEINGTVLKTVIKRAEHHKDDPATAEDDEKEVKPTDGISSWDAEFLQVDQSTLFQMIRAANYLNVKGLLDLTCKTVAEMIKGKTLEEVRQTFYIWNDFSPEEVEQVRRENSWCEGIHFGANGRPVNDSVIDEAPANYVQNVDNECAQVIVDCLNNSVVLRNIFQHFSKPELFELSFGSKMWNYEARSMLKKRGNLMAHLVCRTKDSCQQVLEAFGKDVRHMNVVPYSGITIEIHPHGCARQSRALDSTHKSILDRLPLKHFSVKLVGSWSKDCPALLLVKELIQDFSGNLEKLTLNNDCNREEFLEHFVRDCNFPGLKVLKLEEGNRTYEEAYTSYMKTLVSRAANLQELHVYGPINLMSNVLEGSEAVLRYPHQLWAPFYNISESVIHALRLEEMELIYHNGSDFDWERFQRISPMLLQASYGTLRSIKMDAYLAVPLMCFRICLENVDQLVMEIQCKQLERDEPEILRNVKNFDFTRMFPKLKKVEIICSGAIDTSQDHLNAIIEQADANLGEPMPDRVAHVKELYISGSLFGGTGTFLAEMFPNVEKLDMKTFGGPGILFGSIWKHQKDLKELKVRGQMLRNTGNLDSIFCGIFPEEVAELRQKDEEYLKKVHIVPVKPAVTCLKNLHTLSLNPYNWPGEPYVDDGTFMFSKVTGLIAFARCPSLAVSIKFRGVIPATRHLNAFASVTVA